MPPKKRGAGSRYGIGPPRRGGCRIGGTHQPGGRRPPWRQRNPGTPSVMQPADHQWIAANVGGRRPRGNEILLILRHKPVTENGSTGDGSSQCRDRPQPNTNQQDEIDKTHADPRRSFHGPLCGQPRGGAGSSGHPLHGANDTVRRDQREYRSGWRCGLVQVPVHAGWPCWYLHSPGPSRKHFRGLPGRGVR